MKSGTGGMFALLGALLSSCSPSRHSTPTAPSGDAEPAVPARASSAPAAIAPTSAPAPATASASASAVAPPSGTPLPAWPEVRKVRLERQQGGPSIARCGRTEYSVDFDLDTNRWVLHLCHPDTKGSPGNEPLTRTAGKLGAPARLELEQAYAKLGHEPAPGCGKDGGALTLVVTLRSGKVERWVDQNWGCVQPPPEVVRDLDAFRIVAMSAAHERE